MASGAARRRSTSSRAAPKNLTSACPRAVNWSRRRSKTCRPLPSGLVTAFGVSALASSELPQRIGVVFQGLTPETDRTGHLRFKSPTLDSLPVRQTLWTVFLPPLWTAENPEGAVAVSDRPRDLPSPSGVAAIGGTRSPRCYLSEGGVATLTLDSRQTPSDWPFHRWAAAVALLLFGFVSAGIVTRGKRGKAGRKQSLGASE